MDTTYKVQKIVRRGWEGIPRRQALRFGGPKRNLMNFLGNPKIFVSSNFLVFRIFRVFRVFRGFPRKIGKTRKIIIYTHTCPDLKPRRHIANRVRVLQVVRSVGVGVADVYGNVATRDC